MGFEGNSHKPSSISGTEIAAYSVPVNPIVAEHPIVGRGIIGATRVHSGELQPADTSEYETAKQLSLIAENCNDVLLHAADDTLMHNAFKGVIDTVVSLQNPKYATDRLEIMHEADLLHRRFEELLFKMVKEGGENQDELFRITTDPGDTLEGELDIILAAKYDVNEMRQTAATTLLPMIKPAVSDTFKELAGLGSESVAETRHVRPIGVVAAGRTVELQVA